MNFQSDFSTQERTSSKLHEFWSHFINQEKVRQEKQKNNFGSRTSEHSSWSTDSKQSRFSGSVSLLCGASKKQKSKSAATIHLNLGNLGLQEKKNLGYGAFGTVILCQIKSRKNWKLNSSCSTLPVGRRVAVKCITDRLTYIQEARVLKKLSTAYDSDENTQHPLLPFFYTNWINEAKENFIAMEFLEKGTLQHLVENRFANGGRFSPRQVAFYMTELSEALMFLHDNGIVHGDLKPNNVLLRTTGHICLTDFGNALIIGANSSGKDVIISQSLLYSNHMAPELRTTTSTAKVSWASDLFSLGFIGYYMHHNSLPYGLAQTEKELKEVFLDPVIISKVRGPQSDLIKRLLSLCPLERPKASDILLHGGVLKYLPQLEEIKVESLTKEEALLQIRDFIQNLRLLPPSYSSVVMFSTIVT